MLTQYEQSFSSFDLGDLAEEWCANRDLSPEAIKWLEQVFEETELTDCSPDIAPGWICTELDLPQGSCWPEVLASLLDACLNPMKQTHLNEMREVLNIEDPEEVLA